MVCVTDDGFNIESCYLIKGSENGGMIMQAYIGMDNLENVNRGILASKEVFNLRNQELITKFRNLVLALAAELEKVKSGARIHGEVNNFVRESLYDILVVIAPKHSLLLNVVENRHNKGNAYSSFIIEHNLDDSAVTLAFLDGKFRFTTPSRYYKRVAKRDAEIKMGKVDKLEGRVSQYYNKNIPSFKQALREFALVYKNSM